MATKQVQPVSDSILMGGIRDLHKELAALNKRTAMATSKSGNAHATGSLHLVQTRISDACIELRRVYSRLGGNSRELLMDV